MSERSRPTPDSSHAPDFNQPASIFDLLNFCLSEFMNVSGSLVTRMCEGEFGVTRQEWQFIAMLATLGPNTPSDLALHTTIDRSQGSKTLRDLAGKKLIRREAVLHDRRRSVIHLSERGQQLFDVMFPRVVEINLAVLSVLSESEKRLLADCVHRIRRRAIEVESSQLVGSQANRRKGGSRVTWSH